MKNKQNINVKTYIINENTMVIIPWFTNNAEQHSTVLEQYQVKNVSQSPLTIVKKSSIYYGSNLTGRLESAAAILKGQKMLPVLISEISKECMVPLCSPYKPECIWLNYHHVLDVIPRKNHSIVILSNSQKLELDITRDVLQHKLNNAARLLCTYQNRERKVNDLYRMEMIADAASIYNLTQEPFDQEFEQ